MSFREKPEPAFNEVEHPKRRTFSCNFLPPLRFNIDMHRCLCLEATLKELRAFLKNSSSRFGSTLTAKALLACLVLTCMATMPAFAQEDSGGTMSPYQGEKDGVSAGGKWMQFQSVDKMT